VEHWEFSKTAKYQQEKLAVVSAAVVMDELPQQLFVVAPESLCNMFQIDLHSLKHYTE